MINRNINVKEIVNLLEEEVLNVFGDVENIFINNIKPPELIDSNSLDWINKSRENKQTIAEQSLAKIIICDSSVTFSEIIKLQKKVLIHVKNPKLAVALLIENFFIEKPKKGIHPHATIYPEAIISSSASVGSGCSIGKCIIGDNTVIYPNVTIYDNVKIGNNVIIQAGVVIGTDGLGCERKEDGTLVKFAHLGGVIIENNVEIGANCQIAKGALADTIIGKGSKINGLCFIAHNCILGKNVLITGNTMLAGSVKVGNNVTIYSSVIVREQRVIGNGAIIGMGSVVTKDIPAGEIWFGNPAKKSEN